MELYHLDRPLVVFDIESTGINPRVDRIIELAAIRVNQNGSRERRYWLLNPGVHIPEEATAVHGITDAAVRDCPAFAAKAREIFDFFDNCDLGGYNHTRFDVPILSEEFARAGIDFKPENHRLVDAQRIYHKREPRDLTAAVKFYCGETFEGAHGAEADAEATLRVLEGQFRMYQDLPRDPDALDKLLNERDPFFVDRMGRLRWVNGEITLNFGKHQGRTLRDIVANDPNLVKWILRGDFPRDMREIVRKAAEGEWPAPPRVTPTSVVSATSAKPHSGGITNLHDKTK